MESKTPKKISHCIVILGSLGFAALGFAAAALTTYVVISNKISVADLALIWEFPLYMTVGTMASILSLLTLPPIIRLSRWYLRIHGILAFLVCGASSYGSARLKSHHFNNFDVSIFDKLWSRSECVAGKTPDDRLISFARCSIDTTNPEVKKHLHHTIATEGNTQCIQRFKEKSAFKEELGGLVFCAVFKKQFDVIFNEQKHHIERLNSTLIGIAIVSVIVGVCSFYLGFRQRCPIPEDTKKTPTEEDCSTNKEEACVEII